MVKSISHIEHTSKTLTSGENNNNENECDHDNRCDYDYESDDENEKDYSTEPLMVSEDMDDY